MGGRGGGALKECRGLIGTHSLLQVPALNYGTLPLFLFVCILLRIVQETAANKLDYGAPTFTSPSGNWSLNSEWKLSVTPPSQHFRSQCSSCFCLPGNALHVFHARHASNWMSTCWWRADCPSNVRGRDLQRSWAPLPLDREWVISRQDLSVCHHHFS